MQKAKSYTFNGNKEIKKLELSEESNEILIQRKFDEKLKFYRSNWRKSIKENPGKKKTELRKIAKKSIFGFTDMTENG